jgi:NAD(P)-dependent dehydrogenase (short-subunit alcohol dehydrogenase family)
MGRELVEQLLARGDHVAATVRNTADLADLTERYGDRLWVRGLDVTDTPGLRAVVDEAFAGHDRIDVVVANAGYGVFGVAEDLSDEQIEAMIATNLTGSSTRWSTVRRRPSRPSSGPVTPTSRRGDSCSDPTPGTW